MVQILASLHLPVRSYKLHHVLFSLPPPPPPPLEQELQLSKDGSTEFLYLRKSFPLHQRTTVFPKELGQSGTDSLKGYIRERSLQLITVMNEGEYVGGEWVWLITVVEKGRICVHV